jgi:arylsulfatase A-like enzyme
VPQLSPPAQWFDRHDPCDITLPTTFEDPGEGWPLYLQFIRSLEPNEENFVIPFGPTADQARAAIAATYGMIEFVDDGIGRVMSTLGRLGIADNTIVVFISAHGDMRGDHGLPQPMDD